MKFNSIILDADICIKLGGSPKYRFLEILIPLIAEKVYMHKEVYDEIMMPACAKEQVNLLIQNGTIQLIDEEQLSDIEKSIYEGTYNSLASVMINPNKPKKM